MSRITLLSVVALVLAPVIALPVRADTKPASKAAPSAPSKSPAAAKPAGKTANASAQLQGKILLPQSGQWTWWAEAGPAQVLQSPTPLKGDSISWAVPSTSAATAKIFVLNDKTGNVAVVDAASAAKQPENKLVDSDFSLVRRFRVSVTSKSGLPVSAASVVLKDSKGNTTTRILDTEDKGSAEFFDIPSGKTTLVVGAGGVSITQEVTIDQTRSEPVATAEVILAGDVPTIAPAPQKKAPVEHKAQPRSSSAIVGTIISLLLLAVVLVVIYQILKSRKVTLKSMLEKAGVPLEENLPAGTMAPQAAPTAPPLDPNMVGPAPGAPPVSSAPFPSAQTGPRLVGEAGTYAGTVFPLAGASMVAGRELTCDIALPDDHTVSRRHARITNSGGIITVHDEGSSNGTFVNGQKITEQQVNAGAEIQIGATRFRLEI